MLRDPMLDLATVRTEPERVIAALARRGLGSEAVREVVQLDAEWTDRHEVREMLRQRRRRISEEVARAKDAGNDTSDLETLGRHVGNELAAIEAEMGNLDARRQAAMEALPNLPATDTPDQVAEAQATSPPWPKPFAPLHHADLLEMLGLAQAAASAGHGFLLWRGRGARLVRTLTNFMIDAHTREFGYEEVRAPAVATRAALTGSAHLPALEDKMYRVAPDSPAPGGMPTACPPSGGPPLRGHVSAPSDSMPTGTAPWACHPANENDLFLAPRAEPHLAGLFAGEIIEASRLPVRLASAGPAFRREAGGGGAAGRGLARLHEFPTVELYVFCRTDQADAELAHAVAAAETILARLQLPNRRRLRPAADLSRAAAKTIDLEVWAPGMKQWLAVGALSAFTDYQTRRTDARYRDAGGHGRPVHTLGGAAVALPHLVAALLENGQEADGSVRLPAALAPYVGDAALLHLGHGVT
jgi:seryl-tRNA synthetase